MSFNDGRTKLCTKRTTDNRNSAAMADVAAVQNLITFEFLRGGRGGCYIKRHCIDESLDVSTSGLFYIQIPQCIFQCRTYTNMRAFGY